MTGNCAFPEKSGNMAEDWVADWSFNQRIQLRHAWRHTAFPHFHGSEICDESVAPPCAFYTLESRPGF